VFYRFYLALLIALFAAIYPTSVVTGQSTDSLIYLLNNDLVKGDSARYELLRKIIRSTSDVEIKLQYCDQAIKLAEEQNIMLPNAYILKGTCYMDSGDLSSALEWFIKAATYYKEHNNISGLARVYTRMAEAYNKQGNHNIEISYLRSAMEIYDKEQDSLNFARTLHNLGYANLSMGQYDTALVIFSANGEIFQKLGYTAQYAYCIGNSGLAYSRLSEYDKAEEKLLQAIEILSELGDERAVAEYTIEYAGILQHKGEIKKAIAFATLALNGSVQNGYKDYERDAAYRLAQLYHESGNHDSAFHFQSLFINANDSIKNIETIQKMADLRTKFEVDKKQTEVEILEQNKVIQRIVIFGMAVILLMAVIIILLYYLNLKRTKKLMADLDERRLLLEKQSSELKEKNDTIVKTHEELKQLYEITNTQKEEIISSINYAERIQKAVLPPDAYITELINEHFIFYKPKEIVSGDFYWIKQINHYIILVCADCTGHGVPGAFMSMLGISYLNEIVQRKEITQANQVLNELRKGIKHSLRQTGKSEESREGIDMALCVIDTNTNIMQYSGAFCPIYIISHNDEHPVLNEIKADTMPVGVHVSTDKTFTNHEIQLQIGDTFYISTDGYIDQPGGSNNSRFGSSNFKKLLLEIYDKPLFEQKEDLQQTLKAWMGENQQRDDILVIGARL
jgi:serine phosphatase RsbU (regulator of sigma subunit)/Tfp pilus assembly protein PilF